MENRVAPHEEQAIVPDDPADDVEVTQNPVSVSDALNSCWEKGGQFHTYMRLKGATSTKDALKNVWSTMALISALFATLTMPVITAPAYGGKHADKEERENVAVRIFIVAFHVSTILAFVNVMGSFAFLATVDLNVTEQEMGRYLKRFAWFHEVLCIDFAACFIVLDIGFMALAYYNYSWGIFFGIAVFFVLLAITETIVALQLDIYGKSLMLKHRRALEEEEKRKAAQPAESRSMKPGQNSTASLAKVSDT